MPAATLNTGTVETWLRTFDMAKPENSFIAGVHRYLPDDLYRMKNHNEYQGGVADCWYSGTRGDLWVEYKFLELPKRDATIISLIKGKNPMLSALQQQWLRERHNEGRTVGVIVGCKEGGVLMRYNTWEMDWPVAKFRLALKPRKELAQSICNIVGHHKDTPEH